MKRRLLIDGDIIAYKASTMSEHSIKWEDSTIWTLHADENQGKYLALSEIEDLKENLQADSITIALTDNVNFRKDILPCYKDNRKQKRKPLILGAIRKWLIDEYDAIIYPNLEADDVLGILATEPQKKEERIICSLDKDLRQIPGKLSQDGRTIVKRNKTECDWWHLVQTLTGDAVDGFSGCPSIGTVTAQKILKNKKLPLRQQWDLVVKTYEKKGLLEHDAFQQARVARILRHGEYDMKTGEVVKWQI
jgi:5'-3' exonuclease